MVNIDTPLRGGYALMRGMPAGSDRGTDMSPGDSGSDLILEYFSRQGGINEAGLGAASVGEAPGTPHSDRVLKSGNNNVDMGVFPDRQDLINVMKEVRQAVTLDTSLDPQEVKEFIETSRFDESIIRRGNATDDCAKISDEVRMKADRLYNRAQSIGLTSVFFGPLIMPAISALVAGAGILSPPLACALGITAVFGGFGIGLGQEARVRKMKNTPYRLAGWKNLALQMHNAPKAPIDTRAALRLG